MTPSTFCDHTPVPRDPYTRQVRQCTYCPDNPLTTKKESRILDHVMFLGPQFTNYSARVRLLFQYILYKYRLDRSLMTG